MADPLLITLRCPAGSRVIASETAFYPDGSIWYRIGDTIPCEWEGIWQDRALRRDEWEMQQALSREQPRPLIAGLGLWPTLPALSWPLIYVGLALLAIAAIASDGNPVRGRSA